MKHFATLLFLLLFTTVFAQTAPDFTVTNSDGQTRSLYADYLNQGKVVVIEAFFTTCPPCNAHAPFWQALYQSQLAAHPGQVEFMMLSILPSDNNTKVAQYKTNKGLTMPGVGANGGSLAAIQPYQDGDFGDFFGTPTFILIQPNGEVIFDIRGNSEQGTMDLIAQTVALALSQTCTINSPFGNGIPQVNISATNANDSIYLNVDGMYSLSNVPQLENATYTISATKDDDPLNGVTTFDLVKISRYILGLDTFTQPWQSIAADMNCNGLVTTGDIVEGRKLILGLYNQLPLCGSWRFIPQGSGTQSNGGCVDLLGIKMGDITGPYFAPPPSDRSTFLLYAADRFLKAGEKFTLELTAKDWMDIQSLQLDLDLDHDLLKISNLSAPQLPGFDATCFRLSAIDDGHVPLLWLDGSVTRLYPDRPVITLEGTVLRDGKLSEMLRLRSAQLPAEIYDAQSRLWNVDLQWQDAQPVKPLAGNIFPNPARDVFQASYISSTEDIEVLLQVFDLQGKIVLEKTYPVIKGDNRLEVRTDNPAPGLYVVKVNGQALGNVLITP